MTYCNLNLSYEQCMLIHCGTCGKKFPYASLNFSPSNNIFIYVTRSYISRVHFHTCRYKMFNVNCLVFHYHIHEIQ